MTTSTHPDDIDLFDYVEGDLDQEQHADVAAHIAACPSCADHVRLLERGKGALRESALLHLPPKRRSALLGGLPDQPRERRAPGFSPKRLVAVLVPVAAVLVVAVVLTKGNDTSSQPEQAAVPAAADVQERAAGSAPAPEATGDAGAPLAAEAPPLLEVEGPPAEVVRILTEAGFEVTRANGKITVAGADPAAIELALFGRPKGDVAVYVR